MPIVDCYSEFLPTTARTMHFRLTARDRAPTGGGVSSADTTITVAGTAPFRVTSQASPTSVAPSSQQTVLWDVAATNVAPIAAANVRISYSTDGGLTFPTVLAASTPNDGSADVTVPTTATTQGRFKVEAVDNYFFDVSDANLTVAGGAASAADSVRRQPEPRRRARRRLRLRRRRSTRARRPRRRPLRTRCRHRLPTATPTPAAGPKPKLARAGHAQA